MSKRSFSPSIKSPEIVAIPKFRPSCFRDKWPRTISLSSKNPAHSTMASESTKELVQIEGVLDAKRIHTQIFWVTLTLPLSGRQGAWGGEAER